MSWNCLRSDCGLRPAAQIYTDAVICPNIYMVEQISYVFKILGSPNYYLTNAVHAFTFPLHSLLPKRLGDRQLTDTCLSSKEKRRCIIMREGERLEEYLQEYYVLNDLASKNAYAEYFYAVKGKSY